MNKEVEQILGFTPRALTPRKLSAANPFAATPRRHSGLLPSSLLSPRRPPPAAVASDRTMSRTVVGSPRIQDTLPRPSSAHAILQREKAAAEPAAQAAIEGPAEPSEDSSSAGLAGAAGAAGASPEASSPSRHGPSPLGPSPPSASPASPLRPPPGLAPIVAERLTLDEEEPAAVAGAAPAATAAAEPAALKALDEAASAAAEQAAEQQDEAGGGLLVGFLDRLRQAEAQALRLLKAWLDAAPSGEGKGGQGLACNGRPVSSMLSGYERAL